MPRIIQSSLAILCLAFIGLVAFGATAFAAGVMTPDASESITDLARPVYDAIVAGHYIASIALALVLTVALMRRYARGRFSVFLHSDIGGALATLLVAFFGAIAAGAVAGEGWGGLSVGLLIGSSKLAAMAAGGYTLIKKLIVDPIQASNWYSNIPAWLRSILQVAFWVFDKQSSGEAAIAEAETVGAAAVASKPGAGTSASVDPFEKF